MGKPGLAGTPAAVTRSRIAVRALGIAALALAIAVVPLDVLSRQGSPAEPLVAAASFTAVGLVVARRRPRNPMGWLLAAIGILIVLTVAGGYYAVLAYRLRDRLPLGPLALVLDVFWEPALLLLPLAILLFRDGRLPSRRWRWPHCSTRCDGGCSGSWTGGSTGRTTTRRRSSGGSPPSSRTRRIRTRCGSTCSTWSTVH